MVIGISTEQLNANDMKNDEPLLILISKPLLIVLGVTRSWSSEGQNGGQMRKGRGKVCKSGDVIEICGLEHTMHNSIQVTAVCLHIPPDIL